MENRRQLLANSFHELLTDFARIEFVKSLASLDKHSRLDVLNDQFSINPDNLYKLSQFIQEQQIPLATSTLRDEITLVLHSPELLIHAYTKLSKPEERFQFMRRLLLLNATSREKFLEVQAYSGSVNLLQLTNDLCNAEQELRAYPNYQSTLHSMLSLQERVKPTQTPAPIACHSTVTSVKESKMESSVEMPSYTSNTTDATSTAKLLAAKPGIIPMPVAVLKNLDALFNCPIGLFVMTNPVITPQGTSYECDQLLDALEKNKSDPMDRSYLNANMAIVNPLCMDVIDLLFKSTTALHDELDLNALRKLLTCPLSGEPLTDPVVTIDGITYERLYIEAYLASHGNKTPSGNKQTGPLYPNRFITNLYEIANIDELIETHAVSEEEKLARQQTTQLTKPLQDYILERAQGKNYTRTWFGYCKWDKVIAPTHAIQVLTGRMSVHTFFSQHAYDLKVLKQGNSKQLAGPALEHIALLPTNNR